MKNRHIRLTLITVLAAIILSYSLGACADNAPKPGTDFRFEYRVGNISLVNARLIECDDPSGKSCEPFEKVGARIFRCPNKYGMENTCVSTADRYKPYHKLIIEFSDRKRESNVFEKKAFREIFRVIVTESSLHVESVARYNSAWQEMLMRRDYFHAYVPTWKDIFDTLSYYLFLTIVLEGFFAGLYVIFVKLPKRAILLTVLANVILYPVAWLTFPRLPLSYESDVCMVEIFAVVSEAIFMYYIAKRVRSLAMLRFGQAFAMSFCMNTGSFLTGFLI